MPVTAQLGVCSWSLRPGGPCQLVERVRAVGLEAVQLALDPLREGSAEAVAWGVEETRAALEVGGIEVRSGMMAMRGEDYSSPESIRRSGGLRPDRHWEANRAAAAANAAVARRLGLDLVSFHAGFLPEEPADPEREVLVGRLREVVDLFAAEGVRTALETGQESAATLLEVLVQLDREGAGVNFDPANMLLYDRGDPVEALRLLAPFVRQVHVKDARRPRAPGDWGEEVRAGTGEVDWEGFFEALRAERVECDLMIEREAGEDRLGDVRAARDLVRAHLHPSDEER